MKNLSTGTGLAVLAGAIVAWPVLDRLMPNADAVGVGTTAVTTAAAAAIAQGAPTIVWYGVTSGYANNGAEWGGAIFRSWSDGRIEARGYRVGSTNGGNQAMCSSFWACPSWVVVSDPGQGLTFDADLNFDEAVDGNDLGMLLAKWGPAPRNPVPPSDCPLALINP